MPALRELQLAFGDAVIHAAGSGGTLALVGGGALAAGARLSIYRNNVHAALAAALRGAFPVVERLVGTEFFGFAARRYVLTVPSLTGNLHDYGGSFPDLLARLPGAEGLPYLADVARLEWAWHEVFHAAASGRALDLGALQTLAAERWPSIGFRLARASRLLASPFPVLRIWQANQDGAADTTIDLAEGASQVLVLRNDLAVELHALSAGEFALLEQLVLGKPLAAALDAALAREPAFDLDGTLARHFRLGTLAEWFLAQRDAAGPSRH